MRVNKKKLFSLLVTLALVLSLLPTATLAADDPNITAKGWFETITAEMAGVTDADVTGVSWSGTASGSLTDDDLIYLVRDKEGGGVRIDIPGVKEGTYTLTITTTGDVAHTASGIKVEAHDRSGFAHFNYTEGVGAYKDDGTLKDDAIVVYVTDANKDAITFHTQDEYRTYDLTGIGKILNGFAMRAVAKQEKKPIVFRFVGTVNKPNGVSEFRAGSSNGSMAYITSGANITLEGIGTDATIQGWGISFMLDDEADLNAGLGKNIEVRNLAFKECPEDCVEITGKSNDVKTSRSWVHNCSFYVPSYIENAAEDDKHYGDGALDYKWGEYMTSSYNTFNGTKKTSLVGGDNANQQYHITWHHNWWKDCNSRAPLGRQADMHIYNCLYEGQASYCMSMRANVYIFSENNTFLNCKKPVINETGSNGGGGGVCKSYGDVFTNCDTGVGANDATIVDTKETLVESGNRYANFDTNGSLSYIPAGDYLLDTAAVAKTRVEAFAGPMKAMEITAPTLPDPTAAPTTAPTPTPAPTETPVISTDGKYVLDANTDFGDQTTGSKAISAATPAGTAKSDGTRYFTLRPRSKGGTQIDFAQSKDFGGGYVGTARIKTNGTLDTSKKSTVESSPSIAFSTSGAATVKIWWVPNCEPWLDGKSSDDRQIVIAKVNADDSITVIGPTTETDYITAKNKNAAVTGTLNITEAGNYYLGNVGGGGAYIFKVEVTEGSSADPGVTPTAAPTTAPTAAPTAAPTGAPAATPTAAPTTAPAGVPAAPTKVKATAGDKKVTLSWNAPAGDALVTEYYVKMVNGSDVSLYIFETKTAVPNTASRASTSSGSASGGGSSGSSSGVASSGGVAGGGGAAAPSTTTTTTVANPDGSKITTAIKADGVVTTTVSKPDGTVTSIKTTKNGTEVVNFSADASGYKAVFSGLTNGTEYTFEIAAANPSGQGPSATVKATPAAPSNGGSSGGGGGAVAPTTSTTTKNPDGSTTKTETNKTTGTVTETTTKKDGTKEVVETKKDGTVTETVTKPDGGKSQTVTKPDGSSKATITEASGVKTEAETTAKGETTAQITLPKKVDSAKVTVPVKESTPGTVAVIVKADGTEEIVKTSLATEDGVVLTVEGSVKVKIVDNAKDFEDVPDDHWAKGSVSFTSARELFQGTSATTFTPGGDMDRAMVMTVLARLDGQDTTPKADEPWYAKAMDWAKDTGVSDGTAPEASVSLEQLATMLYRYALDKKMAAAAEPDLSGVPDGDAVSDWAAEAVSWAVKAGILKGNQYGALNPKANASRAQVSTILERYVSLCAK